MSKRVAVPAFLALSCVGFIASAPAYAAGPEGADAADKSNESQDDIIVTGRKERIDSPKATAQVVDTPRSISILPAEVIQQTGSTTLADALRTVPGITFGAAEGGNPVGDRPFLRGFDSQGSTFVDGVRDGAAQSREVFAIEQVQVVKGSDSTLGGRGSAGGSINIITKMPLAADFVAASGSYGTDDFKRVTVDVNKRVSDMIGVRIAGMWHDQDVAGRDALFQKRWGVAPSVKIGMEGPTSLTASFYYMSSKELPDSGIPYLYNVANSPAGTTFVQPAIGRVTTIAGVTGNVDRNTFYGLVDRDFRDTKTTQANLRFDTELTDTIKLRNNMRFSHNTQAYIYTQPDDQQGNVFGTNAAAPATAGGLVWRRANTRYGYVDNFGDQLDIYGTFDTGSLKHSFAVGGEVTWEKARRGTFVLAGGSTIAPRCTSAAIARFYCTSLFDPNPNDPFVNYASDTSAVQTAITKVRPIQETQNDANNIGFYAFDTITIVPQLLLNLGVRYDRFHSEVTPGQAVTATSRFRLERTDELFNWQAGLVFKPTQDSSIYASYATSATPPNSLIGEGSEGNALGTTNSAAALALLDSLKVEKTRTFEVGAKGDLMAGRLAANIAVFRTETQNARVAGPNNTVEFVGERRVQGLEIGLNGTIVPGWTVFGGYSYLDAEIVDGGLTTLAVAANGAAPAKTVTVPSVNTGRQATQTPKHSLSVWTNAEPVKGFTLGGGAFYTSRVYGGYAESGRTATQDIAGNVTITPSAKVNLRGIPSYWRFDARTGYRFNEHLELSVNVQNLTNKTYFTQAFTAHYATIAPGRSAFATLNVKF